jgi:hypothetical protein
MDINLAGRDMRRRVTQDTVLRALERLEEMESDHEFSAESSPATGSMDLALSESSYMNMIDGDETRSESDGEVEITSFLVNPVERVTRSLPSSPLRSTSSIAYDRPTSPLSMSSSLLEVGSSNASLNNALLRRPASTSISTTTPIAATTVVTVDANNTPSTLASSSAPSHSSPSATAGTLPSNTYATFNSSPLSPHARPFTPASTFLRPTVSITAPSSTVATNSNSGTSGQYLFLPSPLPRSPRPSPPSPGRAFAGMDVGNWMVIDIDEDDSAENEDDEGVDALGRGEGVDGDVSSPAAPSGMPDEGQCSMPPAVLVTATTTPASTTPASGAATAQVPVSSPTTEENSGNNIERRLAALHDSDPPFVTDGRGRVVWSRHGQQQQQQQQHRKSAVNVTSNNRREGVVEPSAAVTTTAAAAAADGNNSNSAESSAQRSG